MNITPIIEDDYKPIKRRYLVVKVFHTKGNTAFDYRLLDLGKSSDFRFYYDCEHLIDVLYEFDNLFTAFTYLEKLR